MLKILVSDVMNRNPVMVKPDTNLLECAKVMVRKRSGILILSKEKKFNGVITTRDVLWALIKKSKDDLSKIKAKDISPKKIFAIKPESTIEEALVRMKSSKLKKIPVVKEGEIVGIITIKDILGLHPEIYSELEKFSKIKEEQGDLKMISHKNGIIEEGICDRCGKRNSLQDFNGMLVCNSCLNLL